jgi:hypothetical protein
LFNLSFEFDYRVLSGRGIKIHFVEAKTLNGQEQHLVLEMPTSRMAHTERERENTPTKQHHGKA